MGWLGDSIWEQLSEVPSVQLGVESRTVNRVRLYYNENNNRWFNVGYQVEERRSVKRETLVKSYEMRGLTQAAAMGKVGKSSSHDPITDNYTSTVITARAANDAGGWMAEKTETTLTVTRGTWTYFDDNWDDVIDDRFGGGD